MIPTSSQVIHHIGTSHEFQHPSGVLLGRASSARQAHPNGERGAYYAKTTVHRGDDQIFTPVPELAYQAAANNSPMVLRADDSLTAEQFRELARSILD